MAITRGGAERWCCWHGVVVDEVIAFSVFSSSAGANACFCSLALHLLLVVLPWAENGYCSQRLSMDVDGMRCVPTS